MLRRQPSAFRGASEEAVEKLSSNVIERAKFLLTLSPYLLFQGGLICWVVGPISIGIPQDDEENRTL